MPRLPVGQCSLKQRLHEYEWKLIEWALTSEHNVIAAAARRLGVKRTMLAVKLLRKYHMQRVNAGFVRKVP